MSPRIKSHELAEFRVSVEGIADVHSAMRKAVEISDSYDEFLRRSRAKTDLTSFLYNSTLTSLNIF